MPTGALVAEAPQQHSAFWKENSASPSLSSVNFKYRQKEPPGDRNTFVRLNVTEDQSYRKLRLALASALFFDAAFTYPPDWAPPPARWRRGAEQVPNWLGQPLGPAVLLASRSADLLGGQGVNWPLSFVDRFEGNDISFVPAVGVTTRSMIIKVTSIDPGVPALSRKMRFALPGVRVPREDLFVSLQLSVSSLRGYPTSMARRVQVGAKPTVGNKRKSFTWATDEPFTAAFYFKGIGPGQVDLRFQGRRRRSGPFRAPDGPLGGGRRLPGVRERSGLRQPLRRPLHLRPGPSLSARLVPGLQGTANQNPDTNNGRLLGSTLTLRPRDALFAVRNAR